MMPEFEKNDNLVFIEDGEDKLMPNRTDLRWETILSPLYDLEFMTVGEYLSSLDETQEVKLKSSNWEITEEEYKAESPYHIWNNQNDELHQNLWKFANELINLVNSHKDDRNYEYARIDLDRALSSCTWWWVDGRFNGYYPTAIQKGLDIMINVVRTIDKLELETRLKFEKKYSEMIYMIWERLWSKSN
jgi:hypothetical protein